MARSGKMVIMVKKKMDKARGVAVGKIFIMETVVIKYTGRVNNSSGRAETSPRRKASERDLVVSIWVLNL